MWQMNASKSGMNETSLGVIMMMMKMMMMMPRSHLKALENV